MTWEDKIEYLNEKGYTFSLPSEYAKSNLAWSHIGRDGETFFYKGGLTEQEMFESAWKHYQAYEAMQPSQAIKGPEPEPVNWQQPATLGDLKELEDRIIMGIMNSLNRYS